MPVSWWLEVTHGGSLDDNISKQQKDKGKKERKRDRTKRMRKEMKTIAQPRKGQQREHIPNFLLNELVQ